MSNKNQETIADIVFAMRNEGHTGEASCLEWIRTKMTYYADRIVAAEKREAGAEAAQICGEIGDMVGREASKNQSVTNCNRLGNVAKMREAMKQIYDRVNSLDEDCGVDPVEIRDIARAALASPPRNCDIMDWRTAWAKWRTEIHTQKPCGYAEAFRGTEQFMDWYMSEAKGETK